MGKIYQRKIIKKKQLLAEFLSNLKNIGIKIFKKATSFLKHSKQNEGRAVNMSKNDQYY